MTGATRGYLVAEMSGGGFEAATGAVFTVRGHTPRWARPELSIRKIERVS